MQNSSEKNQVLSVNAHPVQALYLPSADLYLKSTKLYFVLLVKEENRKGFSNKKCWSKVKLAEFIYKANMMKHSSPLWWTAASKQNLWVRMARNSSLHMHSLQIHLADSLCSFPAPGYSHQLKLYLIILYWVPWWIEMVFSKQQQK